MNGYEWLTVLIFVMTLSGYLTWLFRLNMKATGEELKKLSNMVASFSQASMNLAQSVDQTIAGKLTPQAQETSSSRRYLIKEAIAAIEAGQSPHRVGERLQLSTDEVRLLEKVSFGLFGEPA